MLTASLAESLTQCARRGSTLREVLRQAQDTVLSETRRRQEPLLRTIGDGGFLDAVQVQVGRGPSPGLPETLAALSVSGRLGAPAAKALLEALRDRTDTEAERARLVLLAEVLLTGGTAEIADRLERDLRRLAPPNRKDFAVARGLHALLTTLVRHSTWLLERDLP